jgi:hypothetical protein
LDLIHKHYAGDLSKMKGFMSMPVIPIGFVFRYDRNNLPYWLKDEHGYKDHGFAMIRGGKTLAVPKMEGPLTLLAMAVRLRDGPELTEPATSPPAFQLPPGVAVSEHAAELEMLVQSVTGCSRFEKEADEFGDEEEMANPWDGDGFAHVVHTSSCDFTLNETVKFALDTNKVDLSQCDMGDATFVCQIGSKPPLNLFSGGGGENSGSGNEASSRQLQSVMAAVGLHNATAAEFIATIIAFAAPNFIADDGECYFHSSCIYSFQKTASTTPFFAAACELFKQKAEGGAD